MASHTIPAPIVSGPADVKVAFKHIKDSADFVAEVIGEHALFGSPMLPGAVLDMVDILAGRVARRHSGSMVATVAFDRVDFHSPIYHQDLIQAQGHILSVGTSSMVVKITVFRYDLMSRAWKLVETSYVTMVALLKQGQANKDIPRLVYASGEEHFQEEAESRKKRTGQWMQEQLEGEKLGRLTAAEIEAPCNSLKPAFLTMRDTELVIRHTFMPRDLNMNQTVFGGEVLIWMHKVAVQCARAFTQNQHVFTLSMNRVSFKKPIWSADSVEMIARIVFVNDTSLEVEIEVDVTRYQTLLSEPSHSGYFTIENRSPSGDPLPITTGLLLSDDDQESLHRYYKAKLRRQFFESEPEVETLPPSPHTLRRSPIPSPSLN